MQSHAADGKGRTGVMLGLVADAPPRTSRRVRARRLPPEGEIVEQEGGRFLFVCAPAGRCCTSDEPDRELYT